jgi:hypothetical protein
VRRAVAVAALLSALVRFPTAEAKAKPATKNKPVASAGSHRFQRGPQLVYLTSHTAYLGLGSAEGLELGMTVELRRNRRVVTSCQITSVAEHYARCAAQSSMRLGDTFATPPVSERKAEAKPLPPPLGKEDIAQAQAALQAAQFERVSFTDNRTALQLLAARHLRAEIDVSLGYFSVNTQPDPNFNVLSVNATVRGADLGGGFNTSIDLTVLSYLQRPPTYRFPENALTQLFLRQLEVGFRTPSSPWAFAVGRIWPYLAPGVGVLDGAQAGWHNASNTFEGGMLGGTVPNGATTAPTWDYPLVGAYLSSTQVSQAANSWFQGSAVGTARSLPGLGWHYTLDGQGLWSLGKWLDTGAEVRVGSGVLQAPAFVELATFDINVRPTERAQIAATVRYLDDTLAAYWQPASLGVANSSLRVNAAFFYDFEGLIAQLVGTYDRDLIEFQYRGLVGMDLSAPRILGRTGGLSVGFDEAFGWYWGRDAYLQAMLFPQGAFQLILRGGYFYSVAEPINTSPAENGVSGMIEARARLARWFSLQLVLYAQLALDPQTDGLPTAFGFNGTVTATARF